MIRNRDFQSYKKLAVASYFIVFVFLVQIVSPSSAVVRTGASEKGNVLAINRLADCIQSNNVLDVYYLVDDSSSLIDDKPGDKHGSDPQGKRAIVLSESVKSLYSLKQSRESLEINVALGTFGDKFVKRSEWQTLSTKSSRELADSIKREMPDWNDGLATKWSYLGDAFQELKSKKNGRTQQQRCQALVWLTDGAINEGKLSEKVDEGNNAAALKMLCGSAPGAGVASANQSKGALMTQLRGQGVTVMGILLRDPNAQAQGDRLKASVMKAVVTGSGAGGSYSAFKCGVVPLRDIDAPGFFEDAKNTDDLSYQFALISERLRSESPQDCTNFSVDPGINRFTVITTDQKWSLTGPSNSVINKDSAASSGVQVEDVGGATRIVAPLPSSSPNVQGKWRIDVHANSKCQAFFSSGLSIKLDRTSFFQGENGVVEGRILRINDGTPADLDIYGSHSLELVISQGKGSATISRKVPVDEGRFSLDDLELLKDTSKILLQLQLNVKTKGGISMQPSTFKREIAVDQKSAFPTVLASLTPMTDLKSSSNPSKGFISVTGPQSGAGQVCFLPPSIRDSDQNRVWDSNQNYQIKVLGTKKLIYGENQVGERCLFLEKNEQATVVVRFTHPSHAESMVTGEIPILSISDSAASRLPRNENIPFSFKSEFSGGGYVGPIAVLLMLLGIALPLALLYAAVKSTSKFVFGTDLLRSEYEVDYAPGMLTVLPETRKSQYFPASQSGKKSRYAGEPHVEEFETRVPILAFRPVKFLLRAKETTGVFTVSTAKSGISGRRLSNQISLGEFALVNQDVGQLWFVRFDFPNDTPFREPNLSPTGVSLPRGDLQDFGSGPTVPSTSAVSTSTHRCQLVVYSRINGPHSEDANLTRFRISTSDLVKFIEHAAESRKNSARQSPKSLKVRVPKSNKKSDVKVELTNSSSSLNLPPLDDF